MQGVGYLRWKGPSVEWNNGVIRDGHKKEYESVTYVNPFVVCKKEFNKKIEQEDYTDPELKFDESGFKIESLVMECIYRNPHYKEYWKKKNKDMKKGIDTFIFQALFQFM